MKKTMGRPRKYKHPIRRIVVAMPATLYDEIKDLAYSRKIPSTITNFTIEALMKLATKERMARE